MAGGIIDESYRVPAEAKAQLQQRLADFRARQAEKYRALIAQDFAEGLPSQPEAPEAKPEPSSSLNRNTGSPPL
jgi:hypothetical protein